MQKFKNLKGRCCWNDLSVDWKIMVQLLVTNRMEKKWAGFVWCSIGTNGRLFWTQ